MRLAVVTSHPVQYYAPLFRRLAEQIDMHVFYADSVDAERQSSGFGRAFSWDVDLTEGYSHSTLTNVARVPNVETFFGSDTPGILQSLKNGRFDVLLTLGWHLKSLLQAIWAAKRLGMKVIVRGDSQLVTPRSLPKRLLKRVTHTGLLRAFDAALYVGQRNRDYYLHYGVPAKRLFHSPHAIDTARFADSATPESRTGLRNRLGVGAQTRLLLFAGKLTPFKRPLDVVDAANLLRKRGVSSEVLVAGSGELEDALVARATELQVPVHNLGFCNQTKMPAVYAAADALVLPSTARETWGLVCNEAVACGTPIVMSDAVGCAPDLGADGHVGRTFRLGDAGDCASALARLIADPPTSSAVKRVSDAFSLDRAAAGILDAVKGSQAHRPARQAVASAQ